MTLTSHQFNTAEVKKAIPEVDLRKVCATAPDRIYSGNYVVLEMQL